MLFVGVEVSGDGALVESCPRFGVVDAARHKMRVFETCRDRSSMSKRYTVFFRPFTKRREAEEIGPAEKRSKERLLELLLP